ncbi:DNA-deoxyinosine glycosylase [Flavobacterium soli]|uniref:DNA-deoxyinosine glycosylase n=1 Tax=Flavobacterium soli TaxID=344881 RepID=UPI0003F96377|nr:DNA-deoxyinosine glycosylase [Flavobacterium soli]
MISSFPPIIDKNAETLILGTMPGVTSLVKQEYYGYAQNAFWKIMFSIFDKLPVPEAFPQKANLLIKNKIALWDVLQHCERKGSLDIHIKNHIENDFDSLFSEYPKIKRILFNGKESHKYFMKKFGQIEGITYHVMPSTSPANTVAFEKKLQLWSEVLK